MQPVSTNLDGPRLEFASPWMNAAGSLGFVPEPRGAVDLEPFSAFVTNPISLQPRRSAQGTRFVEMEDGVLLHTGFPNQGLRLALKHYAAGWARAPLPIIVHILADEPQAWRRKIGQIEELENVLAIELGMQADSGPQFITEVVQACAGELPLICRIDPSLGVDGPKIAMDAGAAAISLGPARGSHQLSDGTTIEGRLYGPSQFERALAMVAELHAAEIAVIGAGGIGSRADGEAMLAAGALAVQVDIALWRAGGDFAKEIISQAKS
jgi:dihydroorotate dehydrogenase